MTLYPVIALLSAEREVEDPLRMMRWFIWRLYWTLSISRGIFKTHDVSGAGSRPLIRRLPVSVDLTLQYSWWWWWRRRRRRQRRQLAFEYANHQTRGAVPEFKRFRVRFQSLSLIKLITITWRQ